MKLLIAFFSSLIAVAPVAIDACMDVATYRNIDRDIERIADNFGDEEELVHFYGRIVRLAAHDFMDYDSHSSTPLGSDGCVEFEHENNLGLHELWCNGCEYKELYYDKYSDIISRADFWVAAANAVIRQLSVNQSLDLIDTFYWGRKDANACRGSANRLPMGASCREIEDTFLDAMGLTWGDAVALLGAHTLGGGHEEFSGHEGMWMPTRSQAMVFDKSYYKELTTRSWRPRNVGTNDEDFQTGTPANREEPQFMLLTDMCLYYDTDDDFPCCTNGKCDFVKCPRYSRRDSRMQAVKAVEKYFGGSGQTNFYKAFANAWFKATTNGQQNLQALRNKCW